MDSDLNSEVCQFHPHHSLQSAREGNPSRTSMPPFQSPFNGKRKLEEEEPISRKRVLLGASTASHEGVTDQIVWMIQWRNPQYKKHKTWDGDGVLVVNTNTEAQLYDSDGKILSTGRISLPLEGGNSFTVGSKDVELDRVIDRGDFLSGACFGRSNSSSTVTGVDAESRPLVKKFNPPALRTHVKPLVFALEKTDPIQGRLANVTNQPSHWTANWRKPKGKKNKTWDGDSYVSHIGDRLIMISEEGKVMGSTAWKGQLLTPGFSIYINGKEVELDAQVSVAQMPNVKGLLEEEPDTGLNSATSVEEIERADATFIAPVSFYAHAHPKVKGPLFNPEAPDALVMKVPTKEHLKKYNKRNLPVVAVVIDPLLSQKMRPHQREGVRFMYECVMGLRKHEGQGCILADEMGLGKTLQTIALIWTLLKQNPYAGPLPVVQKVLIVCPVSLVNNWKAEFHKWLGKDRVGIVTCDKIKGGIDTFGYSKVHQVLIMGYERLRTVINKLTELHPPIGLIICDEGHRLKSSNNKTAAAFKMLPCRRRIILSGTPIQNDLGEFHSMAEFCNPALLDEYSIFRRIYETPILKSRTPDASTKDIEIGEARTNQLLAIAKSFVLRRDATLLKNHLPPKSEYVVFIAPTQLQLSMFSKILNPEKLDNLMQSSTADSLALINILTKISNSPILLKATADNAKNKQDAGVRSVQKVAVVDALQLLPDKAHIADMGLSGKLTTLDRMLKIIRRNTPEKCVLVSHFTSTLNILEAYCRKSSYSYYRLDGQTPQNKRQEYVNAFNRGSQQNSFIFLLSSKAGGVGINLVGASRLFIIDSDWNPSHDLQSMARCHRDGQKRPVFIYRFLTAGAIDEKIYQRQITKLALSESLIGSGSTSSKSDSFTRKDIRDIFRIHPDTLCNTHDLLECDCDRQDRDQPTTEDEEGSDDEDSADMQQRGFMAASNLNPDHLDASDKAYLEKKKAALAALGEWKHINCLQNNHVQDDILRKVIENCQPGTSEIGHGQQTLPARIDNGIHNVDNVPLVYKLQGLITFLFEKCAKSPLNDKNHS